MMSDFSAILELLPCPCLKGEIPWISNVSEVLSEASYACPVCGLRPTKTYHAVNEEYFENKDEGRMAIRDWNELVKDLVKVTRCKDCRFGTPWSSPEYTMCMHEEYGFGEYDCYFENTHFCGFGEPRKENKNDE